MNTDTLGCGYLPRRDGVERPHHRRAACGAAGRRVKQARQFSNAFSATWDFVQGRLGGNVGSTMLKMMVHLPSRSQKDKRGAEHVKLLSMRKECACLKQIFVH